MTPPNRFQYPVQNGDKISIGISGLNHEGQGVGKYGGFTVFVPFAMPGDRVTVQITEVKRNFARGIVLDYLSPSEYRVESPCGCFHECGGCQLQHFDYPRQLLFKEEVVKNALKRISKLVDIDVNPIIGMDTPFAYRNKAEYPVSVIGERIRSGFYASRSHELISLSDPCMIQHPLLEKTRETFMDICNQKNLKKRILKASLKYLIIRVGFFTEEVMLIVCSERPVEGLDMVCRELVSEVPQVKSVYQSTSKNGRNWFGESKKLVYGKSFIRERIGGLEFDISPGSFFQVNSIQAEVLFSTAVEYAGCEGITVDAYCGTGSISLFLAKKAERVYGFEVYPDAVKDAWHNAEINGIDNVEFILGDVGTTLKQLKGIKPETIVIDPPRKGCDERVLQQIISFRPGKIVYVSCNPATLARDLKFLAGKGYAVKEVQPIDMFPQTYHVECIVQIKRAETRMG